MANVSGVSDVKDQPLDLTVSGGAQGSAVRADDDSGRQNRRQRRERDTSTKVREQRQGETALRGGVESYRSLAAAALAGDKSALDVLAMALTDKTADELAADPAQAKAFRTVLTQIAGWSSPPRIMVVEQGDLTKSGDGTLLPDGVSAAYVPGKNGAPGTILVARETMKSGDAGLAMLEELGEAIGIKAAQAGLKVAPGDVGARLQIAVSGGDFAGADGLFQASNSDTVTVRLNGQTVTAYARIPTTPPAPPAPAEQADALLKAGDAQRGSGPQETILYSELLKLLDIPPGVTLSPDFFRVYARHSGTDNLPNTIDRFGLTKMFEAGVLYTAPDRPGTVFFDPARIETPTLVRGILDHAYASDPDNYAYGVDAAQLMAALQSMTGNTERREVRPGIFNLPSIEQLEALIVEYDKYGGGTLGIRELSALFDQGGLMLQTAALPDGTYYVKVAPDGRVGNPGGTQPTVHPDVASRPKPMVTDDPSPDVLPAVLEFVAANGTTATGAAGSANQPATRISFDTLLDPEVVNWNGRTPSKEFLSMYQDTPGGAFLTAAQVQEMVDDGVLTIQSNGAVFGNMENVSAKRLATGVIRWTAANEAAYLEADPDFARPLPVEGVTNYYMTEKALSALLSTNGQPVEIPSLYRAFAKRGEDMGQGPIRYLDVDGVTELFASKVLSFTPTGDGQSTIAVEYGVGDEINQARTEEFFGPPPPAGSTPSEFDAYEKLTAQELSKASGISLPQARILVELYGTTTNKNGFPPFLTRENLVKMLDPSTVLAPEPMELGAVLTKSPDGQWHVHWDNVEGDVIVGALTRLYPDRTTLQAQEIIDGLETIFGATSIDLDKLEIVVNRTGRKELPLVDIAYLFDRNMIKLESSDAGASVTAVLDTEQNLVGSDPDTASDGLIAGDDDIESIFEWDVDGSNYLEKDELIQFFADTGASPDRAMPVTKDSLEILALIYADTYTPARRRNPNISRSPLLDPDYRFSRDDVRLMLQDGTLRKGFSSESSTATLGSVLDLAKVPMERYADAVFDDRTSMTVDDFLDALVEITGDVNPLKDGKVRTWFRSALGTQQNGEWIVTKDNAVRALKAGVITFMPHQDGSHIRTLPNPAGLLLFNPEGIYDAITAESATIFTEDMEEFLGDFLNVPEKKKGPNGDIPHRKTIARTVMETFNTDGFTSMMNKADFLAFIEAAKTPDHGGQKVFGFDVETALSNAGTAVPVGEGPLANFDTQGYTYDPETMLWQNNVSGRWVDNDGFLVDPETGVYIRDNGGRRVSVEPPLGPVRPDPNPPTGEAGNPVEPQNAEFTPFDGPDGVKYDAPVTIATPDDALNVPLESGEGTVSEQAIARIFERYKNAPPGSTERKHYMIMVIDSMRQRGLSSKEIGTELTNTTYSGDSLMRSVFDADVYEAMKAEVANDVEHQRQFMIEYRREVDKIFAENFSISQDGRLVEGTAGRPITFTKLLENVAQKILTLPDTYLTTATPQQQADLLQTFSLMNSFFAEANDPLLVQIATKMEAMSVAAGASLSPVPQDGQPLEINLDDLTDEQMGALNTVSWDMIMGALENSQIASVMIGNRRIIRFMSLLANRNVDVIDFLRFLAGEKPSDDLRAVAKALSFSPPEFDQLRASFNMHGAMTMVAGVIGVVGLTIRYLDPSSEALARLKAGDPREIVSFMTQISYVSGYILQAAPDTAINFRVITGQQSYGFSDMSKALNAVQFEAAEAGAAWKTVLGRVPFEGPALATVDFKNDAQVANLFGLDESSDLELRNAGLTREGVVKSVQDWAETADGQRFIQKYGDRPGALQAIFLTAVGGDDTYIYSAEANYLLSDHIPPAPQTTGVFPNVSEIEPADPDVNSSREINRTRLKKLKSASELVDYLKEIGMSDEAANITVSEMVTLNNWHHEQIKKMSSNNGASFEDNQKAYFKDIISETPDFAADGVQSNVRQSVMRTLWDVENENNLFNGSKEMGYPTGGRNLANNGFGAVANGRPGDFVPMNLHTAYNPDVHGKFPGLDVSHAPSYVDDAGNGRVAKVFKGLKTVGQYAEWGGDVFGFFASSMDLGTAIRNNDAYDIGAAGLGIANGIFNLSLMILAGSGGLLTIPLSILAGLTGVAQIIMGLVKPPEDEGDKFATSFMEQFDDFPEIFRPGAHGRLSSWHERATDKEFGAWAEEQPIEDENFY